MARQDTTADTASCVPSSPRRVSFSVVDARRQGEEAGDSRGAENGWETTARDAGPIRPPAPAGIALLEFMARSASGCGGLPKAHARAAAARLQQKCSQKRVDNQKVNHL